VKAPVEREPFSVSPGGNPATGQMPEMQSIIAIAWVTPLFATEPRLQAHNGAYLAAGPAPLWLPCRSGAGNTGLSGRDTPSHLPCRL